MSEAARGVLGGPEARAVPLSAPGTETEARVAEPEPQTRLGPLTRSAPAPQLPPPQPNLLSARACGAARGEPGREPAAQPATAYVRACVRACVRATASAFLV